VKNARGVVVGASNIARDITGQKEAEAQRELLVAELSHRVKNTLATVISIARQSFANPDTKEARRSFDARIRALAQTHSRLAESNWSGVSLATMLEDELAPYRNDGNVRIEGPAIELNPKCALTLGLAVHELATNAAKYGALSVKGGVVHATWALDESERMLRLSWTERGGPPVEPPRSSGFGRLLIERALAADLNGAVELEFSRQGLHCTIAIPENQYCVHPA
jgi:two-component sensor histidine kinase